MQEDHCSYLIVIVSSSFRKGIHRRLQQAKANEEPFGGLCVVFIGDPAQLPPVEGSCLWDTKDSKGHPLSLKQQQAAALYRQISIVFKLQEVRRLELGQGRYGQFLENLARADVTEDDWKYIHEYCTISAIGRERFDSVFCGNDSTWLFSKNENATEHNVKMLTLLASPIIRINAQPR